MMLTGILKMSLRLKTSLYLLQLIQALGRLAHHQDLPKSKFLIILSAWDFLTIWLPKPSKNMALESSPPEQHSLPELHSPPEQCSPQQQQQIDSDIFSSDYEGSFLNGFSDSSDNEVTIDLASEAETKLMSLVKMGYNELEASMAIERCSIT